jgi:putative phage-type endonuclease
MLTDEQKRERLTGIGGSDAAAIAGYSRWKSPVDIYLEKTEYKEIEDDFYKEYIYWGHTLEPIIADEYARRSGEKLSINPNLIRHEKYNFMIGNVDRVINGKKAILECKTASQYKSHEWGEPGTDEMPQEYLLQCAHYAAICDANYVDLAVLIGGQRLEIYSYHRNKKLESSLIEIEYNFWHNHVLKQEPPEPKDSSDVQRLYPFDDGDMVAANDEIGSDFESYKATKKMIKELNEQADFYKTRITKYLKNKSALTVNNYIAATWKIQSINRFDTKEFKEQFPEMYQTFLKSTQTRVLRLRGIDND